MYRIAVCDDEKESLVNIEGTVRDFFRDEKITLQKFNGGNDILENTDKLTGLDILLMDIMMPGENGLEVAKKVLAVNPLVQVIFVSGYSSFFEDSYTVPHIWFVYKKNIEKYMPLALQRAKETIDNANTRGILITLGSVSTTLLYKDILYFEQNRRKSKVYTVNGFFEEYRTIDEYEKIISEPSFIRCHKSFLVNMDHAISFGRTSITLSGGEEIPISRNFAPNVQDYMSIVLAKK